MNTAENTVDTTVNTETTVAVEATVAETTTKTRKAKPAKTNAVKGKAGRKASNVTIPSGDFTMKDVESLNPNVKRSTVRAHVNRNVKNGAYKRTGETVKSGGRGKPAYKFTVVA